MAEPAALALRLRPLQQIVQVSDDEVTQAMRDLDADTHNVAEGAGAGAGAASFAAAMLE